VIVLRFGVVELFDLIVAETAVENLDLIHATAEAVVVVGAPAAKVQFAPVTVDIGAAVIRIAADLRHVLGFTIDINLVLRYIAISEYTDNVVPFSIGQLAGIGTEQIAPCRIKADVAIEHHHIVSIRCRQHFPAAFRIGLHPHRYRGLTTCIAVQIKTGHVDLGSGEVRRTTDHAIALYRQATNSRTRYAIIEVQLTGERRVFRRESAVVTGRWIVIDGMDVNLNLLGTDTAIGIGGGQRDTGVAVEVFIRREGQCAIVIERDLAVFGTGRQIDTARVPVTDRIGNVLLPIFIDTDAVNDIDLRGIVDAGHAQAHRRGITPTLAVTDAVTEARVSVVIRIRREHDIAIAIDLDTAVFGILHRGDAQTVTIDIGIVGQ